MNDLDLEKFARIMTRTTAYYNTLPLSADGLDVYFNLLQEYSIEQIGYAIKQHMKESQFYPRVANIISQLEGGDLSLDDIIASARIANTPFGVLARLHIGKHDLDHMNSFDIRARAAEVKSLMPQWKQRAMAGEYSEKEIIAIDNFEVNCQAPFIQGMQPIKIDNIDQKLIQAREKLEKRIDNQFSNLLLSGPDTSGVTPEDIEDAKQILKNLKFT